LTGYGTFVVRKLSFEIRLICNRRRLPVFSLQNSGKTFSVKETLFPFHMASQELSPSRRTVEWEGDAAISLPPKKVVAEELEDLALKGLAQLRYAEREKQWENFLGKRRESRRAR
jgi:hypothetical protein